MEFTKRDVEKIAKVLGVEAKDWGNNYRLILENAEQGRKLSLEIYPNIPIGSEKGNLISVYTHNTHLQLHFCTGFVISEMLGEVTFIGEYQGRLSGLIIEKEAGCSLYSNVDTSLLSGDFTKLGPEVMLSGIALSLSEGILPESD
ncbi:hypothetical protein GWO43_03465 [candidate division KSB1 bacterium]|nr:hypothetical protein [candidate division KSB1 bacterium]NIR70400.1 hypothetical protein [candidate division KSB1 bacterium]NIS25940.1 hypothetical protein [candidate division KSB1 bacterium]NIT69963.1 hypothetical protein [candidate division KSB1 bacterium]NIU26628.1 hypothetical protein [candidate division KSB1 bacterium]